MEKKYHRLQIPWQSMEDRVLILANQEGEVHELNETGSWIWTRLDEAKTCSELTSEFLEESEGDKAQVQSDFEQYLETLCTKRIIKADEHFIR